MLQLGDQKSINHQIRKTKVFNRICLDERKLVIELYCKQKMEQVMSYLINCHLKIDAGFSFYFFL